MTDRVAIVTGASRGIGRAIAVALGGAGFGVAINYNTNDKAAEYCASLVREAGGKALVIQADVVNAADRRHLVDDTIAELGPIDLLINNAGVAPKRRADLLETSEQSFDQVLATNLKAPFLLTQRVAQHMIEQRGDYLDAVVPVIVNVGSISAMAVSVNRGEYCISKAGLSMMTQLFAARLAEHSIGVFEIRPGIIATDMTTSVKAKYDQKIRHGNLLPMPRWGKPQDVAEAVLAIVDGHFPYSTGQVIHVDGGFHLRRL